MLIWVLDLIVDELGPISFKRKYKYPLDDPSTGEYTVSVTRVLDQAELQADFWAQNSPPFNSHQVL